MSGSTARHPRLGCPYAANPLTEGTYGIKPAQPGLRRRVVDFAMANGFSDPASGRMTSLGSAGLNPRTCSRVRPVAVTRAAFSASSVEMVTNLPGATRIRFMSVPSELPTLAGAVTGAVANHLRQTLANAYYSAACICAQNWALMSMPPARPSCAAPLRIAIVSRGRLSGGPMST